MKKKCAISGAEFEITEQDLEFYARVSPAFGSMRCAVPPPTLSPEARLKRRLCWRNERTLYRRKCDYSGKEIVSTYAAEAPFPVYESSLWHSDCWDPFSFGREFDFSRPFFEQFAELLAVVPMFALFHQQDNENCPYTNLVTRDKNCHYVFAVGDSEHCFYSTYMIGCRDTADCFFTFNSELCYECIDCNRGYNLFYSRECESCSFSEYLLGCIGCANCFGCVSLAKKEYCFFNQQLSAIEYKAAVKTFTAAPDWHERAAVELAQIAQRTPRKFYSGFQNEQCTGDHILWSKNAVHCFDVTRLEDCKYCTWLHQSRDCYDCYAWGLSGELGLENHLCGNNFTRVLFSEECCNNVSDLLYCRACHNNSSNLFGCIGLRNSSYCILNKQYTKDDYNRLVPKIIDWMGRLGEWGEFFPAWLSPYGYNETVAEEYFPLSAEGAAAGGFNYRHQPLPGVYSAATTDGSDLPLRIEDIENSICSQTIRCLDTGKGFRITRAELELYRKLQVPVPGRCFDARYKRRFNQRNSRNLFQRCCDQCKREISSSYPQKYAGIVVCEECFHRQL